MGRGRPKKYLTEEERKAARKEYLKQYYRQYRQDNKKYYREYQKQYQEDNKEHLKQYRQDNKDKILEQRKRYYQNNKKYFKEYHKEYYQTPMGRASTLVRCYQREDKKYNRGECTLTPEWMIENIFSKPCHYCGETDWTKIGCDRIDNSKPHTPDNVVPCCWKCNVKKHLKDYEEFVLDMMLIQ